MFRYVDEAATLCPEIIPSIYNEAKTIRSNTEDPFYFSARFFDKIIGKNYEESELDGRGEIIFHVISQYVRSLMHGCCHLHQSLARLLTVRLKSRPFDFLSQFQCINKKTYQKCAPKLLFLITEESLTFVSVDLSVM